MSVYHHDSLSKSTGTSGTFSDSYAGDNTDLTTYPLAGGLHDELSLLCSSSTVYIDPSDGTMGSNLYEVYLTSYIDDYRVPLGLPLTATFYDTSTGVSKVHELTVCLNDSRDGDYSTHSMLDSLDTYYTGKHAIYRGHSAFYYYTGYTGDDLTGFSLPATHVAFSTIDESLLAGSTGPIIEHSWLLHDASMPNTLVPDKHLGDTIAPRRSTGPPVITTGTM